MGVIVGVQAVGLGWISGRIGRSWRGVMVGVDDGVGVLLGVGVAVSVTTGRDVYGDVLIEHILTDPFAPQTAP